jgi:hypothetical protein
MIKTLLAGAFLGTGLLAGGAEDVKMDNLKSNENSPNQSITMSADGTTLSFSQNFELPKDTVPATPKGDAKTVERTEGTGTDSGEGKMVETKVGAPEQREGAKTVERTEGTGTDSGEGKMVETKVGAPEQREGCKNC